MTLYYSPFFTGECYRNYPVGQACLEKVVGDAGLLDFLELRLGLPGGEAGAIDRILAYEAALRSALTGAFYKDAFEKDSLATAKEILRWRDTLVMEGFDAHASYESSRLRTLAQVEKVFGASGTPERWKIVRESAKGPLAGVEIIVCHDMDLLPKLIRETLKALGVEKGRYDGLGEDDLPFEAKGKKISILPGTLPDECRAAEPGKASVGRLGRWRFLHPAALPLGFAAVGAAVGRGQPVGVPPDRPFSDSGGDPICACLCLASGWRHGKGLEAGSA